MEIINITRRIKTKVKRRKKRYLKTPRLFKRFNLKEEIKKGSATLAEPLADALFFLYAGKPVLDCNRDELVNICHRFILTFYEKLNNLFLLSCIERIYETPAEDLSNFNVKQLLDKIIISECKGDSLETHLLKIKLALKDGLTTTHLNQLLVRNMRA